MRTELPNNVIYIQHTRDSIQAQIRTAQDEQTNSNCIAEAGNYFYGIP